MLNLLNEVSSLTMGIVSLIIVVAIITTVIILNCKLKSKTIISNSIALGLALIIAIFLCKPILSVFDKIFNFSSLFFNSFMLSYAQIDNLNTKVTTMNYYNIVNDFKNSNIGMSSSYKNFLVNIFENTIPPSDNPTTLSAIASSSMSYMVCLFIIALILFVVSLVLFKLLIKLISKKIKFKTQRNLKPLCVILGVTKSLIATIILLVTISTLPLINVTNDYFGNGFGATKVLSPVYNSIVNIEQKIYVNSIDYAKVNRKIFQTKENIQFGTYQNSISGVEHRVNLQINNNSINVKISNLSTYEDTEIVCYYIYANNNLYAFKDNVFKYYFGYNEKAKTITFNTISYGKMTTYTLSII